jgi:hypothetical protein
MGPLPNLTSDLMIGRIAAAASQDCPMSCGKTFIAAFGLLFAGLLGGLPAAARPSNEWRIQCSSDADSAGVVTLRLSPVDAGQIELTIPVADGTGENKIARTIRDALKRDPRVSERYKVEVDDGEDVLVKRRRGQPDFDLEVVSHTIKGFRIRLDRG